MTNLVFIEHKKVPKDQTKILKRELQSYAISLALKFPAKSITEKQKIKIAKISVKYLVDRSGFLTKNLGEHIHNDVIEALQKLYFKLNKKILNYHLLPQSNKNFLEIIKVIKFLRKEHPKKYKKIFQNLQKHLSNRQKVILNLYLNFKPSKKKQKLTYQTISKISKTSLGTITGDIKKVVCSLSKIFKLQRINYGK